MTTAYVFPGQGSQTPGMGQEFYRDWERTRRQFDDLDDAIDLDLASLCFEEDADRLRQTANTQPAVFATGVAVAAGAAERLPEPDYVAGHSLGHFTAATAAAALSPSAGIELVYQRGQLMHEAARRDGPGTMVAVLLADPDVVADVCADYEDVSVGGFNAPRQTVVSGAETGVNQVQSDLEARTRARFVELDVGAAFHSPVMETAEAPFREVLAETPFQEASVPVCSDVTGEVYTEPAVARRDLATQITSPIDWVSVIETLAERGVDRYIEFPPAGTLVDLIEKTAPDADAIPLETPSDIESINT